MTDSQHEVERLSEERLRELTAPIRGNTGHGHVWPRPDGRKARCGGPALCSQCAMDQVRYDQDSHGEIARMARELLAARALLNDINRKPTPEGK